MELPLPSDLALPFLTELLLRMLLDLHKEFPQHLLPQIFEDLLGGCRQRLQLQHQVLPIDEGMLGEGVVVRSRQHLDSDEGIYLKLLLVARQNALQVGDALAQVLFDATLRYIQGQFRLAINHKLFE